FICIGGGGAEGYLRDGDVIAGEAPLDLIDMISERSKEANVTDLLKEIHTLFKNVNDHDRSSVLMNNLAATSGNLRLLMADPKMRDTVTKMHSILQKIDRGEGTLGRLVNDPTLYDKLIKMLGESPRNQYFKSFVRESVISEPPK